jgi:hypothetical protein
MPVDDKSRIRRKLRSISVKTFIDDYVYRIDLEAEYQREKIWSRKNQEELLDSIIKNIDIPKLYLAQLTDNENFDYECIDGKQRMATLLSFFKPEPNEENPLVVRVAGEKYTYKRLKKELPALAKKFENFKLTFVIYPEIDDEDFLREIFRRLQLGVRLNSGELLKAYTGAIRDFVYEDMGKDAPFLKRTSLLERRFSREVTLAQMCINSFSRAETGAFARARTRDLEEFFKEKYELDEKDENLARIRKVLEIMDEQFADKATSISSRAVAVSAYLFVEGLYLRRATNLVPNFVVFYLRLLDEIKSDLLLLRRYQTPTNPTVLEGFQKHISQASVEPYAIRGRDQFLAKAFEYYLDPKTGGKIVGTTHRPSPQRFPRD